MGVSPFSLFVRRMYKTQAAMFKGMPITQRGKTLGNLYRKMGSAEKAALLKDAAKAPSYKHKGVARSVLKQAREARIPTRIVKEHWKTTKAGSTASRLRAIAAKLGLKRRVKVAGGKKASAGNKAAGKKASAGKKTKTGKK